MPTNNHQVNQITEYLESKIRNLKDKVATYESPISQELLKGSDTMQLELVRVKTQLEVYEDLLLVITKFTSDEPPKAAKAKNR